MHTRLRPSSRISSRARLPTMEARLGLHTLVRVILVANDQAGHRSAARKHTTPLRADSCKQESYPMCADPAMQCSV